MRCERALLLNQDNSAGRGKNGFTSVPSAALLSAVGVLYKADDVLEILQLICRKT